MSTPLGIILAVAGFGLVLFIRRILVQAYVSKYGVFAETITEGTKPIAVWKRNLTGGIIAALGAVYFVFVVRQSLSAAVWGLFAIVVGIVIIRNK
jgi:hypothetical protein